MQSGRNALLTTFSSDLRFASQSHPQILRRRNVGLFSGYGVLSPAFITHFRFYFLISVCYFRFLSILIFAFPLDFDFHVFDYDSYVFDFEFHVFDFDFYIFDFKFEIFEFDCKNIRLRVKYYSSICNHKFDFRPKLHATMLNSALSYSF